MLPYAILRPAGRLCAEQLEMFTILVADETPRARPVFHPVVARGRFFFLPASLD
jgi:hypothetical protein